MIKNSSTRLNKYISESGICSRREADKYILAGNVLLNGRKAKVTDQVFIGDKVMVNGQELETKVAEDNIYIAFNKPVGITTTTEATTKGNIVDYVNHSTRIFPIGRLDKDSQGLIFLTNNGDIVNKILRASNNHQKEYLVTVNKPLTDQFIVSMAAGVPILGTITKKCIITKETPFIFKIILVQGMNRQIRRMCEHFDYEVLKLERIRIMNVGLKGLQIGDWRELTALEIDGIFKMIGNSSSDYKATEKQEITTSKKRKGWVNELKKVGNYYQADNKPKRNPNKISGKPLIAAKRATKTKDRKKQETGRITKKIAKRGKSRYK